MRKEKDQLAEIIQLEVEKENRKIKYKFNSNLSWRRCNGFFIDDQREQDNCHISSG